MSKGKLYLMPSTFCEKQEPSDVIPSSALAILPGIRNFVVEEARTVRRFLSKAGLKGHIEELNFVELNEHTTPAEVESMEVLFEQGDVALISEAGLPAVADPGSSLVALCHRKGIRVVPLVGPSSLMLALMASGLNGQSFAFCGYLPAKTDERRNAIKSIEKQSAAHNQSQIFIETPYRNDSMLADLISFCNPQTKLCIAADISLKDEYICTKTIAQWKNAKPEIGKRPCVFILLAK